MDLMPIEQGALGTLFKAPLGGAGIISNGQALEISSVIFRTLSFFNHFNSISSRGRPSYTGECGLYFDPVIVRGRQRTMLASDQSSCALFLPPSLSSFDRKRAVSVENSVIGIDVEEKIRLLLSLIHFAL